MSSRLPRLLLPLFALLLGLGCLAPAQVRADLELAVVINPDPAESGEVLDVALTVMNTSSFERPGVVLNLHYPNGLHDLSDLLVSDNGVCSGYTCDPNEFVTWNLGTLAAGAGQTVTLPPTLLEDLTPGTVIEFSAEAYDSANTFISSSHDIVIESQRTFELALSEPLDAVQPGGSLRYNLDYGFSATSTLVSDALLGFYLPEGTRLISASDGGQLLDQTTVGWPLGDLIGGQVGQHHVLLEVDSAITSGHILTARAWLTDLNTTETPIYAQAVTRVELETPLDLSMTVDPDPALPGEVLDVALTVTNASRLDRTEVVVKLRYPSGLQDLSDSLVSHNGTCNLYTCDPNEFVTWTLGTLTAGTTRTVTLPPTLSEDLIPGSIIKFNAVATDSMARSRVETTLKVGSLEPGVHSLSIDVSGLGRVTSQPAGIDCAPNCVADFTTGTEVTLTATPSGGWQFAGWDGACTGSADCTLTIEEALSITANFIESTTPIHNLSISKLGGGTVASATTGIDCGNDCSQDYASGSEIMLAAIPDAGWQFVDWSGICAGVGSTCTFILDEDKSLTATFEPIATANLSLGQTGNGNVAVAPEGIDCGTDCHAYPSGTEVTLTATPDADWQFVDWSGVCTGAGATCTVTVDEDKSISAIFELAEQRLSVTISNQGTVTSEPPGIDCGEVCSASYATDSEITLTATPADGWQFASWTGACTGRDSTCTLTLNTDKVVTARFAQIPTLTVALDGLGTVTSEPSGIDCGETCTANYALDTQITLTAAPDPGWQFIGWGGACTGSAECLLTLSGDLSVTANFTELANRYQLDSPVNGSFESGIGLTDGWVCEADQVEVRIDDQRTIQTAYGAERPDSQDLCGDTANGFAAVINWNNYDDGVHILTLLADGQPLTQVEVTVTTLGEEFLRGVSATTTVPDFPDTGLSTTLVWSQPHQNFVVAEPRATIRQIRTDLPPNNWESPLNNGFESGYSLIRGWACEASTITATLDGETLNIPYGSSRPDTEGQDICGDSDNGYALAINWNDWGDGDHQITLAIDGQEVTSRRFRITTPGGQGTVIGVQRRHTLSDFPHPGDTLTLQWSEPHQNYRIVSYLSNRNQWLGAGDEQVEVTGEVNHSTHYLDFGGRDTFTLSPELVGPIKLIDQQVTTVILPEGLHIEAAAFLADGLRFTINGYPVTLLGNLREFSFVFAGEAADPMIGVTRSYAETAEVFGASIPAAGAEPVFGSLLGTIASDGSLVP